MQFILGLVVGAALMWLAQWLQRREIAVRWYEWLLAALGFILLVWGVNDFFGSLAERNETAARVFLWLLGLPAVMLLGLAVFLPWRRLQRPKIAAKPETSKQKSA